MRIAFVTSGLEPGSNGVGDYCRRLGAELAAKGHRPLMVSLNDSCDDPSGESGQIPVVRLGCATLWPERIQVARKALEDFNPDWVSLQFVCYGFQPKGLIDAKLQAALRGLFAGFQLHVMLHELWVMWPMRCRLLDRITGQVQQRGILRLLRGLQPRRLDTTIPLYQAILQRSGLKCGLLPLCGNIPVRNGDASGWLGDALSRAGLSQVVTHRQRYWLGGFFGTIFPHWDPAPLLDFLGDAARKAGSEVVLLSAGRCGEQGKARFQAIPPRWNGLAISRCRLGPLEAAQASEYFNSLDFGVVCYSPLFAGKSGVAASMIDHGLPVIAAARSEPFRLIGRELVSDPRCISLEAPPASFLVNQERAPSRDSAADTADRFLIGLEQAVS